MGESKGQSESGETATKKSGKRSLCKMRNRLLAIGAVAASGCHPRVEPSAKLDAELIPDDLGSCAQGIQLAPRQTARQRGHPAIGAGAKVIRINELKRSAQRGGNFLRSFDNVCRHIDGTNHHFFTELVWWPRAAIFFAFASTVRAFLPLVCES